jgi:hypothetical protein
LSGLSYPQARLEIVHKKVIDNKEIIKKNLVAPAQQTLKNDLDFLNDFGSKPDKKSDTGSPAKNNSIRSKMDKYLH